jgi:hypothetical protein
VRKDEATIVVSIHRPDPRIEELHDVRAGLRLRQQMRDHDVGERPQELLEEGGVRVHQRFRSSEGSARPSLDQVAREREWRAREPDQGDLELLHEEPDGLRDVRLVDRRIPSPQPRDALGVPDRLIQHRTSSRLDPHRHADRGDRHHDVGEQDRGVERHATERLQRQFDDVFGLAARLQDVRGAAELPVFGEVAAGLAHEPHRRAVDRLVSERAQETVVRRGPGHTLRIRRVS